MNGAPAVERLAKKTLIKVNIEMLKMRELSISQGAKRARETLEGRLCEENGPLQC